MNIELSPWLVPNYVTAKMPPVLRQEGFKEAPKWALSEVDAEELSLQCDKFREEVFRKAGKNDPKKK